MAPQAEDRTVSWPTLGFLISDWIAQHCVVPAGFAKGEPFIHGDWQLWACVNEYRVRPEATRGQLAPAFHYRRTQLILPQKTGKGPYSAADAVAQGLGPVLFAGWADGGETYECRYHGCSCGWGYEYTPGEPMGMPWPQPLIQVTAFSQDQADNIWAPLQAMLRYGALAELARVGEEFIRLPNDGRIDMVTASAKSRLGNPITHAFQDEVGLWDRPSKMIDLAENQRRGLAGMGGRAVETTNAFDPAVETVARRTYETTLDDVFRLMPQAPSALSFGNKRERRQILKRVYAGSPWVDLDAIEAEAAELIAVGDCAQAERFFGNRLVTGSGYFFDKAKWDELTDLSVVVPRRARITLGFDGSDVDDWTCIRARWLRPDGSLHAFTPRFPDGKPMVWNPADHGGEVPRLEVDAAMDHLFNVFRVLRLYADPPRWESDIARWSQKHGAAVQEWATYRIKAMSEALDALKSDIGKGTFTNDGDPIASQHIGNARRRRTSSGDIIEKPEPSRKIDAAMSDCLAHEAALTTLLKRDAPAKRSMVVVR